MRGSHRGLMPIDYFSRLKNHESGKTCAQVAAVASGCDFEEARMKLERSLSLASVVFVTLAAIWATAGVAANGVGVVSPPAERERQTLRWHVAVVPAQAKPGDEVEIVFAAD